MSKSIFEITSEHGQNMYINGLQHAINMFEILGEDALPLLKQRLAEARAELEKEEQGNE